MEKLLAFYKWRENIQPKGGFRYKKETNVFGEEEIKFEVLREDEMLVKESEAKVIGVHLIKNILNKLIIKRKAFVMRRVELELFRISNIQAA